MYIVSAYDKMQMSGDMAAPYRQESNFFWLTKINQAGWLTVKDQSDAIRLVRPTLTDIEMKFDGYLSDERALEFSGATEVWSTDQLEAWLAGLEPGSSIGALQPLDDEDFGMSINPSDARVWNLIKKRGHSPVDIRSKLSRDRALKSSAEIVAMQKSIDTTIEAFEDIKSQIDKYTSESEIAADMTAHFMRAGGEHAYQPIVASGINACTMHYIDNNQELVQGSFVLLDVGVNIDGYNADLTRTYAVGEVSERQRAVHNAVERSLHKIISTIKPGVVLKDYVQTVDKIILGALVELGLASDEDDEASLRRYMPHSISHGLGLDVHESLVPHKSLQVGMILTVEPGIYIPEESIGVRIEENILVTKDGNINLSAALSTEM